MRWPTSAVRRGGSILAGVGPAGLWIELSSVKHCEVLGVLVSRCGCGFAVSEAWLIRLELGYSFSPLLILVMAYGH